MNPFKSFLSKITKGKVKAPVASAKKVMPAHQAAVANDATSRTLAAQHTFAQLKFKTLDEFLDYVLDPKHFASSKVLKNVQELAVAQSANPDKAKVREQIKNNPALLARFVREEPEVATAITEFVIANMPEVIALMAKEGSRVNRINDDKMSALVNVFEAVAKVNNHKAKLINQTAFPNYERVCKVFAAQDSLDERENIVAAVSACPQVAMGELGEFIASEQAAHAEVVKLNTQLSAHVTTYNQEVERLKAFHKTILDTKADTDEKKDWITRFNAAITAFEARETALETVKGWLPDTTIATLKEADTNAEADILHYIAAIKTFANANNLVGKKPGSTKYDDIALTFDGSVPPIRLINAIFKKTEKKDSYRIYMADGITADETDANKITDKTIILTERQVKLMQETYARLAESELSDADATRFNLVELKKVVKTQPFEAAPFAVKKELYDYIRAERVRKVEAAKAKAAAGTPVTTQEQAIIRQYNQFLIDHMMTYAIVHNSEETQKYVEQKARRQGLVTLNAAIAANDTKIAEDCSTYNTIAGHLVEARSAIDADLQAISTVNGTRRYAPFVEAETTATDRVVAELPVNRTAEDAPIDYIPEPQFDADNKLTGFNRDIKVIKTISTLQLSTDTESYKTGCETTLATASTTLSAAYTAFDTEGVSADYSELVNQTITLSDTEISPLSERVINHTTAITDLATAINEEVYEVPRSFIPMPTPYTAPRGIPDRGFADDDEDDTHDGEDDAAQLRAAIRLAIRDHDKTAFKVILTAEGLTFTKENLATLLNHNGFEMDSEGFDALWTALNAPEAE